MNKILLFLSKNEAVSPFVSHLASISGLELKKTQDIAYAIDCLIEKKDAPLFIGILSPIDLYQITVKLTQGERAYEIRNCHNLIHVLVPAPILVNLGEAIDTSIVGSIVIVPKTEVEAAARVYSHILSTFYQNGRFHFRSLFSPSAKYECTRIGCSDQKEVMVEKVKMQLLSAECHTRIAAIVANAVDELLMNAMYDAPTDLDGRHLYVHTSRSSSIQFEENKQVEIHLGMDSNLIGIGVVDHFGSLKKEKLFEKISQLFYDEQYQVNHNTAGAGLGITLTFKSGASIFFVTKPGIRTEVYVLFKRTKSYRDFRRQFQFLSTFFHPNKK